MGQEPRQNLSTDTQSHCIGDEVLRNFEMNLTEREDIEIKVIGKETIFCDGEPVKCWKISQNGGGIREQFVLGDLGQTAKDAQPATTS